MALKVSLSVAGQSGLRRRTGITVTNLNPPGKEALLKRAAECERQAVLATDKAVRSTYIELARQWRDMAQQVELLERQYGPIRDA